MSRRHFLRNYGGALAGVGIQVLAAKATDSEPSVRNHPVRTNTPPDYAANRPSRLAKLPADFNDRVGAAHVAGKYHLTQKPFLLEGAEKLIELGTRLGKFWLNPARLPSSYSFNSHWDTCRSLVDLARAEYFQQLLALPFRTLIFEAHTPIEEGWMRPHLPASFYEQITREFYDLAAHFYEQYAQRDLTIILQNWEGDWLLRRGGGVLWDQPPSDWKERCQQMAKWLQARQSGVTQARQKLGAKTRCRVAHAAEVNRVADLWQGIPTMTEHVLPQVELDLVSYSAYDGMKDAETMWRCVEEIRRHAHTGSLFGDKAVYIGEIGIPENDQPDRIQDRWDEFMGVFLAAHAHYVVHWELYCNEFSRQAPKSPALPITDPALVRGFWLVKPDGSLSQSGRYFQALWQKAKSDKGTGNPSSF